MNKKVINDLFDYENRRIVQDDDNFKFSLDSILLAEFVDKPKESSVILDMCTGNAPIPLILSTKYTNSIIGFEIQKHIYDMAEESINLNNCANQIKIINDDVKNIKNYFPGNNFDIITCNPPYFKAHNKKLQNDNEVKAIARHEIKIELKEIIKVAADNLNNKGNFYLVHRPERIDEIMSECLKNNLAVKKIYFITTKEDNEPSIVLIKAVKNGGLGVKVHIMHNLKNYESYQNIF